MVRRIGWGRSGVVAIMTLGALTIPGAGVAEAAPGGDALIQARFLTVFAGSTPSASRIVMCPVDTVAVGGGVSPTSYADGDAYHLQLSGPVEADGKVADTDTGDVPRGWAVTISVVAGIDQDARFKVFALCSRDSDAVLQAATGSSATSLFEAAPQCPDGSRAIGGGVGSPVPVPAGEQHYLLHASNPVDSTLTTSGTKTGDVAVAWYSAVSNQLDSAAPRFFSICSAKSDGTVSAFRFTMSGGGPVVDFEAAYCPNLTRALSGGVGVTTSVDASSDAVEISNPFAAGDMIEMTNTGDIARDWGVEIRNTSGTDRTFKVMAICATTEARPDALIKRATQRRYTGGNVYSPTEQSIASFARRGQTRTFNVRIENDGEYDAYTIHGCAPHKAYRVTYIDATTGKDVTTKVTGAGYVLTRFHTGRHRGIIFHIRPTASATIGKLIECHVTVTSTLFPKVHDTVRADVTVTR